MEVRTYRIGDEVLTLDEVIHKYGHDEIEKAIRVLTKSVTRQQMEFLDLDDLRQEGYLGLMGAIDRFDNRGKFTTYIRHIVLGKMQDAIRRHRWRTRTVTDEYGKMNKADERLSKRLGRKPTDEEISVEIGKPVSRMNMIRARHHQADVISIDDPMYDKVHNGNGGLDPGFEQISAGIDVARFLDDVIEDLPDLARAVLIFFYKDQKTIKEIGRILGISDARVCQLRDKGADKMRTVLEERKRELSSG